MKSFEQRYQFYQNAVENAMKKACAEFSFTPEVLTESMRYSLLAGGKRVRPVLFFAVLDAFGINFEQESDLAVAIECIHTYSLVHDDLPAMDNDDFRRGKPSSHKQFGEANAILAGDALLSYAFDLLLNSCYKGEKYVKAAKVISSCAGAEGMIAGQSADLLFSGKKGGEKELNFIYLHKTAKLIVAPLEAGAILAGQYQAELREFGEALGALFQLVDDILDEKGTWDAMGKTLGKDKLEDKLTGVKVYGMERAEALADEYAQHARKILQTVEGDTSFLEGMVSLVRGRNH